MNDLGRISNESSYLSAFSFLLFLLNVGPSRTHDRALRANKEKDADARFTREEKDDWIIWGGQPHLYSHTLSSESIKQGRSRYASSDGRPMDDPYTDASSIVECSISSM